MIECVGVRRCVLLVVVSSASNSPPNLSLGKSSNTSMYIFQTIYQRLVPYYADNCEVELRDHNERILTGMPDEAVDYATNFLKSTGTIHIISIQPLSTIVCVLR